MECLLKIGNDKAAVQEVNSTILAILASPAADKVKIEALRAVGKLSDVHATVQNCTFTGPTYPADEAD